MFWNTDKALTVHVVYMHASLLGWGKIKFTIYAEYQNLTSKTCNLMKHNERNVSVIMLFSKVAKCNFLVLFDKRKSLNSAGKVWDVALASIVRHVWDKDSGTLLCNAKITKTYTCRAILSRTLTFGGMLHYKNSACLGG